MLKWGSVRALATLIGRRNPLALVSRRLLSLSTAVPPCWSCGLDALPRAVECLHCNTVLPFHNVENYFELFDTPISVAPDLGDLQQRYRQMQRKLHPDLFSTKSQEEQQISSTNSALVNRAYQVLVDPTQRMSHLLSLHGIGALEEGETHTDTNLLMEVLEIREELEECFSLEKLRETRSHNESQITACLALLKAAYEDGAMQQFSSHVVRHRYLVKITEEIDAREEELERS